MTQSGQGNEPQPPAAPPAHEGVVLPSAGLRHGGGQGADGWPSPEQGALPAEGQPWGDPWGPNTPHPPQGPPPGAHPGQPGALVPREPVPGQALPPAAPTGYGPLPGQDGDATQYIPHPVQAPGQPLPDGFPADAAGGYPGPMPGGAGGPQPGGPQLGGPQLGGALPLPAEGAPGALPQQASGGYGAPGQPLPAEGQHPATPQPYYGQPQQAQQPQPGYPQPEPAAPGFPSLQPGQPAAPQQPGPYGAPEQAGPYGAPEQPGPYGGGPGQQPQTQILRAQPPAPAGQQPPHGDLSQQQMQSQPPQPQTQILRAQQPAPGQQPAAHTQILRPTPPAPTAEQGHTQILRPTPAGPGQSAAGQSLPQPELRQPESPAESTTMLRRPDYDGPPPAGVGTAEETQVLPGPIPAGPPPHPGGAPYGVRPGAPGDRQPPAEFDGLFRAGGAADGPESTQQMPLYDQGPGPQPAAQGGGPYPQHGGYGQEPPADVDYVGDGGGGRRSRRGVIIGVVVAACAVAGLAAGAAISMSGGDGKKDKDKADPPGKEVVASDSPPPSSTAPSPSEPADPAEPQAKALDALLKDSNSSRASVIASVNNIKTCKALPKAASDLRAAARQRNALVTRLGQISVDKLPQHTELTQALTKAWRSSASADNHYAAWADQVGKKNGCHKGKARSSGHTALGNRASGEASAAKNAAAKLWTPLARKYKLTERGAVDL
ncbi:hypothetical protein AAHZ94_31740 [Streptomyces sp. HSW2009]|uniref:hypothetical protein n=1 Tax=Streptomyces sp. HSW2009 TaxID=3142890 RepID=UPI0032ED8940